MNGKLRGYSLDGFDWTRSTLSKLLHSKQASTVERFVEVWKTDIQPHSRNSSIISSTPISNNTPPSGPSDKGTPSRKRNAADACLAQHSSTPPALRPVHIVSDPPNPEADTDSTQLDEAIEKGVVITVKFYLRVFFYQVTSLFL